MGNKFRTNNYLNSNLKALRESRGLKIPEVSIDTGFTYAQIDLWENRRGGIPYASLAKLCLYYGYFDIYKMITVEIRFTFNPIYATRDKQQAATA